MEKMNMNQICNAIASDDCKASLDCSFRYNADDTDPKSVTLVIDFSGIEIEHLVAEGLKHLIVPAQARMRKGTLIVPADGIVNVKYDDVLPKKKIGEQGRRSKLTPEQKGAKIESEMDKLPADIRNAIIAKYLESQK